MKVYAIVTFLMYFSLGSLLPLISEYLVGIGFTGTKVGIIMSTGTFMTIFFQPFWGLLADKTNNIKKLLIFLSLVSGVLAFLLPLSKTFAVILILYALLQLFVCGVFPLNDAGILHSKYEYGKIRLWGAIGFAVAVQISAFLSDYVSKYMIFVCTGLALILCAYFVRKMNIKAEHTESINKKLLIELLKNRDFLMLLTIGFFIAGTINAHNTYFALFYIELGGKITGVGLAFLLFALSEVPFFSLSAILIRKVGLNNFLLVSGLIFSLRWLFYSFSPSPVLIISLFFLQGLSIGSFLAGVAEYIKTHTQVSQTATALTIYNSVSLGIGTVFCVFISGKIIDAFSAIAIYRFYFIWTLIGLFFLILLVLKERKKVNS